MKLLLAMAMLACVCLGSLTGCNAYSGLASPKNDDEYIQEAQKCMREGDFTCALEQYGKISSPDLKNEKICLAQLTRSGLGLEELVTLIASPSGSKMLGSLATAMMPWSEDKEAGSVAAIDECAKLSTITDTQKQSLLRILSFFADCAIRIAKTDIKVATSESSVICNSTTAGNLDGDIDAAGIAVTSTIALSTSNTGMCEFDVRTCSTDLSKASALASGLGGDLADVFSNITAIPSALKDSGALTPDIRTAILSTL